MAGTSCRCGGTYLRSHQHPDGSSTWTCNECQRSFEKGAYGSKTQKKQKEQTHQFSLLEIGKGIAEYIIYLESEVSLYKSQIKELNQCLKDKDALQRQINEMQEKYNSAVLDGETLNVPRKHF